MFHRVCLSSCFRSKAIAFPQLPTPQLQPK